MRAVFSWPHATPSTTPVYSLHALSLPPSLSTYLHPSLPVCLHATPVCIQLVPPLPFCHSFLFLCRVSLSPTHPIFLCLPATNIHWLYPTLPLSLPLLPHPPPFYLPPLSPVCTIPSAVFTPPLPSPLPPSLPASNHPSFMSYSHRICPPPTLSLSLSLSLSLIYEITSLSLEPIIAQNVTSHPVRPRYDH